MKRKISLKLKSSIKEDVMSKDKVLEQHLENFKKWLEEEGIDPASNLGSELTKQTRLLMELERKLQGKEKNYEIDEKEEWLKAVGAVNIENFKYMMPAGNHFLAEEYIKMTPLEKIKEDCCNAWRLAKQNRR